MKRAREATIAIPEKKEKEEEEEWLEEGEREETKRISAGGEGSLGACESI